MNRPQNRGAAASSQPPPTPGGGVGSAWEPLHLRVYRTLLLAQFVSNVGGWMQTVGAQWLITEQGGSPGQVALVQTAASLPVLLLGVPAGALADIVDRRRLLITTQLLMFAAAGLLAILTTVGRIDSYGVLILTFVLGCGSALMGPAWQATQPELVSHDQIPAAAALGALSMNLARAVGPALGGVLVALAGPHAVFAINAVSFLVTLAAVITWQRRVEPDPLGAERALPALRAGYRYVRNAPRIRRILGRALLFIPFGAALWALLPVAAEQQLGLNALGYGLLLGAVGVGAVVGALLLPRLRARWSSNVMLVAGGLLFAGTMAVLALVGTSWIVAAVLVVSGVAWIAVLSTLNSQMQVTAPAWVRARALAVYLTLFQGGQAIGSAVWGAVTDAIGLQSSLLIAAVLLAICSVVGWRLSIPQTTLDRSPSMHWPEPTMILNSPNTSEPVLVTIKYQVPSDRADAFVESMDEVRRSRLRTGALRWDLYQDGAHPDVYLETFLVASWEEHLRQHGGRLTGSDRDMEQQARSLVDSEHGYEVSHYLPARGTRT